MKIFWILNFALLLSLGSFAKDEKNLKTNKSNAETTKAVGKNLDIIFKADSGKTEFTAIGKPAMLKINGEGPSPSGVITVSENEIVNGKFNLDLTKLTTKIDIRDDHMKNKYLEVEKFPTAVLEIKNLKLPTKFSDLKNEINLNFEGQLTMHGQTKKVTGKTILSKDNKSIKINSEFTIKVMEFLSTLPEYKGIKVADDVNIKISSTGMLE